MQSKSNFVDLKNVAFYLYHDLGQDSAENTNMSKGTQQDSKWIQNLSILSCTKYLQSIDHIAAFHGIHSTHLQ